MVQHRIKPPHGLWLIAGDHYEAPNGLPAFAERLLFGCQSSCDQVGRLCRAETWHMPVIEVRFKLEKETKGALRYQEVDEIGEVIKQAWAKIGTLFVRKSAFERGAPALGVPF